jgi:outer membrane protein assembly factor BamB
MNKLRSLFIISSLLSFFSYSSSLFAADWLHFGHDSQFTSENPEETMINSGNISRVQRKWGIGCDDGYFSVISRSPAIRNGILYTSGAGSRLTAYDAITGDRLWQFGNGNRGLAPQPVVSEDGIVFYLEGADPATLYAVDAENGQKLWEGPFGLSILNDTALVTVDESNGMVYVVEPGYGGRAALFALDKQTGEVVWYRSEAKDGVGFGGDYVLLKEGKIFAATYPNAMVKLDVASQSIETTFAVPPDVGGLSNYTLCNERLVVSYNDFYGPAAAVVGYGAASSTITWQKAFSGSVTTGAIACNTATNRVYVPTDPYLYALDASTGAESWRYTGYGAIHTPSIANGIVYFLSDTNMYAVDETSGTKLFSYPLGYEANETAQVAVADGMLYFSGNGGTCDFYALSLSSPAKGCAGDCRGDGKVTVDEIIMLVNIALGNTDISACPMGRLTPPVTVDQIIQAVNSALNGCQ